jgi:hypothetical protein
VTAADFTAEVVRLPSRPAPEQTNVERPLRVSVLGNSIVLLVSGPRGDERPYRTYPAVLRDRRVLGRSVEVSTHARIWGLVREALGSWADPLGNERPDVVVLHFGIGEAFPALTPRRLNYYLLGTKRGGGRVAGRYWWLARRILLRIHAFEKRFDGFLPRWWGRSPWWRFESDLLQLCRQIDAQLGAKLVLVDAVPPTSTLPFATPNMAWRVEQGNRAIQRVADEVGATVLPLGDAIAEFNPTDAMPDGVHLSVEAHRAVGERLAAVLAGLDVAGVSAAAAAPT